MLQYIEIKKRIENYTGVKDIGSKSRNREGVYLRTVYYQLSLEYITQFNDSKCGAVVNRDRCSVLYHLKNWRYVRNYPDFKYKYLYNMLSEELDSLRAVQKKYALGPADIIADLREENKRLKKQLKKLTGC